MKANRIHYGWIMLVVGILVVAGSLGFGRFSYGMILPSMQTSLGLTHDETGIIASANMFGYFLAALMAGMLASRYGPKIVITVALFWTALSMAATALAGGVASLVLFRFLTGVGGAGGNISIMGLSSSWFAPQRRGMANGFLVGGSGLAMAVTGWIVPAVNQAYPDEGWRYNWLILAGIVAVIGALAMLLIKNHPREKGLAVLGGDGAQTARQEDARDSRLMGVRAIFTLQGVRLLAFTYFCFGMSYIIYAMFFVNYLVGEKGFTQVSAGQIWSAVGLLSIGSAIIWGSLSDLAGRQRALLVVFTLQAASYLILVSAGGTALIWVSAILFGLTAWSIPGIVASFCGDLVGPKNAPAALGLVTFFFGFGQVLGPISAGYIKQLTLSFSGAFYLSALLACLGGVLALWTRQEKRMPAGGSHNL